MNTISTVLDIPNSSQTWFNVDETMHKTRIDLFLRHAAPHYSRAVYQRLIAQGMVLINDTSAKASSLVRGGDVVQLTIVTPAALVPDQKVLDALAIKVVYEHPEFLVIHKPAGLVVHKPSSLSTVATVADWIVAKFGEVATVGAVDRPGIVHRLDKDTSGLLLIARTASAHMQLSELFKRRLIKKTYIALVAGRPAPEGTIAYNIMRHPSKATQMSHSYTLGKPARTTYVVKEQFTQAALIEAFPVTGRTHQIRVHCAAIGHPLLGDPLYGTASSYIARHALHAARLAFTFNGTDYTFFQELPEDFVHAIEKLRHETYGVKY